MTTPRAAAALAGLRVLDATDESGRLAGKLLAELGADVVRLRRGAAGASLPGAAGERGGVLDWWYDAGTRALALDLDDAAARRTFRDLVARADVLLETEPPGRLARLGLGAHELRALQPRLVHVSLTPFGADGPRAHWQASDLVAGALGGVLAVTGTPDEPLNGFGRQSFNVAGFYAAITALVALRVARAERRAVHVDLSLQQCVLSCTEQLLMYWFFQDVFPGGVAPRRGSLHWTGVYEVMPCASGHAMVTPAPNAARLFSWMAEDALCGLTYLTNPEDRRDVGHGISITDHVSGLAGALAVLAALEVRERTGRGQMIDLSQLEVGLYLLGPALLELASGGREAQPRGNRDGLDDLVPNEVYRCRDGEWLAVSARDDAEWRRLRDAVGDPALGDEALAGVAERRRRRAEIDARLAAWAARRDAEAAMVDLQERGVPAGKVQSARDVVERDPQLASRGFVVELPHASLGRQAIDRFPARLSGCTLEPYRPSPAFGEHTFEVYGELLGMSEDDVALAIADGLFA
ncbi:MAG: CoA transferase [Thermodesulfobacteriota bacterium]